MNRNFFLRGLLTIVAIVSLLPLVLPDFFSSLPFNTESEPGIGYVVREVQGLPLPAGLKSGDVLALDRMTPEARAAAIFADNLREGSTYPIVVRRGDEVVTLPVTSIVNDSQLAETNRLLGYPFLLGVLALALLTLWRGRDWTARGLTLFSLGLCVRQLSELPAAAWTSLWMGIAARFVMWLVVVPGLYIATEALVGAGLSPVMKRRFRFFFAAVVVLTMTVSLVKTAGVVLDAWIGWIPYQRLLSIPGNLALLIPLLVLLAGYRNSDTARRLRIRWVLWSTGVLGASVIAYGFVPSTSLYGQAATNVVQGLSLFGYVYAVLRHRLVDVSFIVDRALVYGLTTSLVVGVFAILENFIEQAAVGNDASFVLQAGATLVLALILNRVHRRVEDLVDRLFFRRQRRAAHELRRFAQQCGFIEQHERLLSLTAERIEQAIAGSGVAIYERRDGCYRQLIARGDTQYPATVDVDDLALISLRASLQALDLDADSGSAFGVDGGVFPMALRGRLLGVIVCGARRGEQFAPDERAELTKLAQEVGIALYVLRAREHEQFVAAVASGEMHDPQHAARQLLPTLTS